MSNIEIKNEFRKCEYVCFFIETIEIKAEKTFLTNFTFFIIDSIILFFIFFVVCNTNKLLIMLTLFTKASLNLYKQINRFFE